MASLLEFWPHRLVPGQLPSVPTSNRLLNPAGALPQVLATSAADLPPQAYASQGFIPQVGPLLDKIAPQPVAGFESARFGGSERPPVIGADTLHERMGGNQTPRQPPSNFAAGAPQMSPDGAMQGPEMAPQVAPAPMLRPDMWQGMRESDVVSPQGGAGGANVDRMATGAVGAPQSAPAAGPGGLAGFFGGDSEMKSRLQDFFTGLAMGGTPSQSIAAAAAGVASGKKGREAINQTAAWLESKGVSKEEAKALAKNPTALQDFLKALRDGQDPMRALQMQKAKLDIAKAEKELIGGQGLTDDIKEWQFAVQNGYSGTFQDWQTKGVREQDKGFSQEQGLRKEYIGTPEYKRFDDINSAYGRLRTSALRGTGAGDIGVIFGYMKILDPGSVVREGEQATAQNSSGVPDRVRNLYNQTISGQKLTPEQREEIVGAAEDLYLTERRRMEGINKRYRDIADANNINPARVIFMPPVPEFAQKQPPGEVVDPLGIR